MHCVLLAKFKLPHVHLQSLLGQAAHLHTLRKEKLMFLQCSQIQSLSLATITMSGSHMARWPRQCLQLRRNLMLRDWQLSQNQDRSQSSSGGGSKGWWGPSKRSGGGERGGLAVLSRGDGEHPRGGVLSWGRSGGVGARAKRLRSTDVGPDGLGLTDRGRSRQGTSRWSGS